MKSGVSIVSKFLTLLVSRYLRTTQYPHIAIDAQVYGLLLERTRGIPLFLTRRPTSQLTFEWISHLVDQSTKSLREIPAFIIVHSFRKLVRQMVKTWTRRRAQGHVQSSTGLTCSPREIVPGEYVGNSTCEEINEQSVALVACSARLPLIQRCRVNIMRPLDPDQLQYIRVNTP